jgi:hypothetical protein
MAFPPLLRRKLITVRGAVGAPQAREMLALGSESQFIFLG